MADERIEIEITLDDGTIRKGFGTIRKQSEKTGRAVRKNLAAGFAKGLFKRIFSLKSALAGVATAFASAFAFRKIIAAANQQEDAINSLNTALRATGRFSQETSEDLQNFASSIQQASKFGDELILQNQALLQSLGDLSVEGLKDATQAAVDMAAALQIDLRTATLLVGKAAAGEIGTLSRYGIIVKRGADNAETFANVLDVVNTKFGGAARAQLNTFSGATTALSNAIGDAGEELGFLITKSPLVIKAINVIRGVVEKASKAIKEFAAGDRLRGVAFQAIALGQAFVDFVITPAEAILDVVKITIGGVKLAIAGVINFLVEQAQKVTGFLSRFSETAKKVNNTLKILTESTQETFKQFAQENKENLKNAFDFNTAEAASKYLTNIRTVVETVRQPLKDLGAETQKVITSGFEAASPFFRDAIKANFTFVEKETDRFSEKFRAELQGRLTGAVKKFRDGVAGSFSTIGEALVKGENGFAAFGKAILGLFGDLAIQLGQFYFLLGLGNLFLNPGAAAGQIAAGLALQVLGGVLKGLAGGGGQGAGAGAAAGGGAAGGGELTAQVEPAATLEDPEERFPTTNVTVNVEGNVLDRRETGLELVEIINESFGSDGVTFARAGV